MVAGSDFVDFGDYDFLLRPEQRYRKEFTRIIEGPIIMLPEPERGLRGYYVILYLIAQAMGLSAKIRVENVQSELEDINYGRKTYKGGR